MKIPIKNIGSYLEILKVVTSIMNGKKFNTGTLMILIVFALQQIGIPESEAKLIFTNCLIAFGSILAVWGFIHRLIKSNSAKKEVKK